MYLISKKDNLIRFPKLRRSLSFIVMYYQEQSRRSNKNDTIHFYEAFIRFARNGAKWQDALNNRETQRLL